MHELTYKSKAVPQITQRDVKDILETSRRHNFKKNITGCLVFHRDVFVQIIEGKEEDILSLYDKIKCDKRHTEVELLWEGRCSARSFSDWQMAYYKVQDKAAKSDISEFEKNLLQLSELVEKPSASTSFFWKNVRLLLARSKAGNIGI